MKVWNESMRDSCDASGSGDGPVIDSGCPFFAHVKKSMLQPSETNDETNKLFLWPFRRHMWSCSVVRVCAARIDGLYIYIYVMNVDFDLDTFSEKCPFPNVTFPF